MRGEHNGDIVAKIKDQLVLLITDELIVVLLEIFDTLSIPLSVLPFIRTFLKIKKRIS